MSFSHIYLHLYKKFIIKYKNNNFNHKENAAYSFDRITNYEQLRNDHDTTIRRYCSRFSTRIE